MNYVDIAIIAIIALCALIGLWRGFGKTLVKLICFGLALLVTWLTVNTLTNWLLGMQFVNNFITGDGVSLAKLYYSSFGSEILEAGAGTKLGGALGLYINPMIERFTAMGGPASYGITYAQFIAINLSVNTLGIILGVLIYLVARLVAMIISWIIKKIFFHGSVHVWSRLVGFLFGAVRGATFVMVLLIISTIIFPLGFATPYTESVGSGIISNFAAEQTYKVFDAAMYGGKGKTDKTQKMLEAAGYKKGTYEVPTELDNKKKEAVDSLTSYYNGLNPSGAYNDGCKAELDTRFQAGKDLINAAENQEGIDAALDAAKAALDDVLTMENESTTKTEAKNQLQTLRNNTIGESAEYDPLTSKYSEANFNKIKSAHGDAVIAIDAAKSKSEVTAVFTSAQTTINNTPTILDERKAAWAQYKLSLEETGESEYGANWSAVENILKNADEAIIATDSVEVVDSTFNVAKAAIDGIEKAPVTPPDGGDEGEGGSGSGEGGGTGEDNPPAGE